MATSIDIERGRERLRRLLQSANDASLAEFLAETPAADLAEMMAGLSETRRRQVFQALDVEAGARVLETMTYEAQYEVIRTLRAIPDSGWDLTGVHPLRGPTSAAQVLDGLMVKHVEDHVAQIDGALSALGYSPSQVP